MSHDTYDGLTIVWGAGRLFHTYKQFIESEYGIDYICDRKLQPSDNDYDGYRILTPDKIKYIKKCRIILCMADEDEMLKISLSLIAEQHEVLRLIDLIPTNRRLTTEELYSQVIQGGYIDYYGNSIKCESPDCLDKISFKFVGRNGSVCIGKNVWIANHLEIECGNDSSVVIGDDTTFDNTVIYSAYTSVNIGKDCMFSYGVFIRNHDSHFIFDKTTGKRVNYNRSINIGDHVWIGQGSLLLAGFSIDKGSIVGAGSVSSSSFDANQVIAGNPAKVIRKNVLWDRAMTWINNFDSINEIQAES